MNIRLIKIVFYSFFLALIPVISNAQVSTKSKFYSDIELNYDVRSSTLPPHAFTINGNEGQDIITILSTDLSTGKDPDDWIDTYLFLTHSKLNPSGIILDTYATDKEKKLTKRFLKIVGKEDVPVVRGVQKEMVKKGEELIASKYKAGAEFILKKMKQTEGKVRLIAVGTLRNEALAYHMNPGLFSDKIEKLYWVGGTWGAKGEVNLNRDRLAVQIITNSDIPKIWVPCISDELKQKLTGKQEELITKGNNELTKFYQKIFTIWRGYKPDHFFERTNQALGEGKNLWSLPAFLKAIDQGERWLTFVRGTMHYDKEKLTWFEESENGKDMMLKERKEGPITNWAVEKILEFN